MSPTPALVPPVSVPSSAPSDVPSTSLSYISSSPFAVNMLSLSLVAPIATSVLSNQSQQLLSASRTPMAETTVTASATPTSHSLSIVSSTTSSISASVPSMPSSTLSTTFAHSTSSKNRPTLSTFVQPTTTSTTVAPTTTASSTSTSSSITTSLLGTTVPSTSTTPSTSHPPSTIISPSLSSVSPSYYSSPAKSDALLTTVLEGTTIFITSTNSQGQLVTSVPPVVTEVITTTGSGGIATTITQAVVNPTLVPNNSTTEGSSFFTNTGAVVGVFVVVGLASASIMMWIFFAIRRRLRMRGIEEDNAAEVAVAAAGLNRAPLDDDDDDGPMSPSARRHFSPDLDQPGSFTGSLPTSAPLSEMLDDFARDSDHSRLGSPMEHLGNSRSGGYVPARTASPSPRLEKYTDDLGSSRDRKSSYGHTPTYSAGSFEPLLANYVQNMSDQDTSTLAMEPQRSRSSQRLRTGLARNKYSPDRSSENRTRTSLRRQDTPDGSVLVNEEDIRYTLTVRNVPDSQSQHSL